MRIGWNSRKLSAAEQGLVTSVYGRGTVPSWDVITVNDGLGIGDRPWTDNPNGLLYAIAIGPVAYPDVTSTKTLPNFGRIDVVFIHEMAHVWQYFHGNWVKLSSVWGQSLGDGYDAVPGKAWNDYNVEQQATLVEDWYEGGMNSSDDRFPYIEKVVRRNGGPGASKSLADLKAWTP